MDATTSRTNVTPHTSRVLAGVLLVLGVWLIEQGLWISVKAIAAQWFLQQAWAQTLKTQQPAKPWPWADTWPVGRLLVPRHGIDQIILADASGRSLAFGPGQVGHGAFPDGTQLLILSGHRDTHFSFLRKVQPGEFMIVHTVQGNRLAYRVEDTTILNSRTDQLFNNPSDDSLILITCYPFDAVLPGGPLRYVVRAEQVPSEVLSSTASQ
ncbi:class GN sortase [Candidatus Nitrospira neomarina]|uniref:Class GN sortase n=1 Tax=Candidatus Nitrospira neomarina TaxID=3020899 RepID=A0AA96GUF7_9BACT|nr:class GN sortase [Candidatus Nitrospira neomarina]WNM63791.1 class GN sortase [Candidatus Nitrospira neomarina]